MGPLRPAEPDSTVLVNRISICFFARLPFRYRSFLAGSIGNGAGRHVMIWEGNPGFLSNTWYEIAWGDDSDP